jgi:hypothetical protein
MVDQEYTKVSMDYCLSVISALSTQDMQSRIRIEIHAKAQENRLTILK